MRIGITGHIGLHPASQRPIFRALRNYLRTLPGPVHGVSCLADGADRLFVEAVQAVRGTFEVVLPVLEAPAPDQMDADLHRLLGLASAVTEVSAPGPPEAAYEAANRELLRRCEVLVAVWDGDERGGRGGTAETVALAQGLGKQIQVVWPAGSRRWQATGTGQSLRASSSASVLIAS